MFFELLHKEKNTRARAGIIHTDHGDIETPAFMPVGTQASVKTLDQTDLDNIGAQIILGNTYHLHLRPGEDLISKMGGLHKFMNWNKPILTDSGGFQVFSLGLQKTKPQLSSPRKRGSADSEADSRLRGNDNGLDPLTAHHDKKQGRLVQIDEDGVTFQSHIDGSAHRFTPESSIKIQYKLGADIIMAFDECTPDNVEKKYVQEAMERTHKWAKRSFMEHQKQKVKKTSSKVTMKQHRQFLFGIIQGGNYKNLREKSAKFISSLDFDGIAIGGESIGYNMKATKEILNWVFPIIPESKPHYAMGVGLSPLDMLIAIEHGIDMFDCVAPTRLARHGMVFITPSQAEGRGGGSRLNLKSAVYKKDTRPIDECCACSTCQKYSRAYLHHLFNAQEISVMRLASIHNLYFVINLMKKTRMAILENRFNKLKRQWII